MIKDTIKFTPQFAKADSGTYSYAGVEVTGATPERLWRIR